MRNLLLQNRHGNRNLYIASWLAVIRGAVSRELNIVLSLVHCGIAQPDVTTRIRDLRDTGTLLYPLISEVLTCWEQVNCGF